MSDKWPLVIFNVALGFSSYWALKSTAWFMKYARGAERIHFITGVMATVVFSVPQKEGVYTLLKQVYVWCHCLSAPLVASEVYLRSGYVPDLAPLHLAIPVYVLIRYYLTNNVLDMDMMAVGQALSIFSLAATSMASQNVAGIFLTVIYLNTSFSIFPRDPFTRENLASFTLLLCMINCILPDALYWGFRTSRSE